MPTNGPTGSLKRAVVILKVLASAGEHGLALTQLSQRCGLPNSSTHRVLRQLHDAGLVHQPQADGPYALGPLAFELGIAAAQQFDIRGRSRQAVATLAKDTGDTVFLFMRSGSEAVCLDRLLGSRPGQVATLRMGSRRPLGLGAGGLAILAAVESADREEIIADVSPALEAEGIDVTQLRDLVDRSHRQGYAFIEDQITPGVSALGRPILDSFGQPVGAVSVAAPTARMLQTHVAEVATALDHAVRRIQIALFTAGSSARFRRTGSIVDERP